MRWKSHVRFGGRAAETHQPKGWQGAAVRPLHRAPDRRGQLYLCAVKDACSNRIVGYSMDARMTAQLAVDAINNAAALRRHRPVATVVPPRPGRQGLRHSLSYLVTRH
jgi:transposase InsO family protein